ncbi:MAG: spore coat associated protein CotJA [Clostridia bacterium]|nr:spore coat associated protein CotJA [Clostridia bacterium]MBR4636394.1 spore coat associated protein CotJA [Clostridia bacterium]
MNEIVIARAAGCCCGMNEQQAFEDLTTVPAGGVSGGLGACGYSAETNRLPRTIILPQTYREGFCPEGALETGTMFPELADSYR